MRLTGAPSRTLGLAGRVVVSVAVAAAVLVTSASGAWAATTAGRDESELVRLHNQARAAQNLAALADDIALRAVARDWAHRMADAGRISHNPNVVSEVDRRVTNQWTRLGENVGVAPDAQRLHDAFMASSGHRANILGQYNRMGIGAARGNDGRVYVAVVFLQGPALPVVSGAGWAPFTNPYDLAEQQYRDFLNRPGDAGGVDHWATLLRTGQMHGAAEIEQFLLSAEFGGVIAPVVRLYYAAFNRIPDQSGLQSWIDARRGGASIDAISQAFTESAEFRNRYDSLANRPFVDALYRNVFGRPADPSGLNHWSGQLDSGRTRGWVLARIAESGEFVRGSQSEVSVVMTYAGMLRRSPDPQGYEYWVGQLDRGVSVQNLVVGFLSSAEYRSRF